MQNVDCGFSKTWTTIDLGMRNASVDAAHADQRLVAAAVILVMPREANLVGWKSIGITKSNI